ncbi:helix-turn-helix transcriptional regulator [Thiomicrorhabdus indica]|uniref:helix-turn-helix transcriptional regulator n=1 Tax=Thiomicrorhabdus indica TaxID=2267253 RepID=UPI002AA73E66|nr:helix-turn-helix transcriptional regulator [Thiomicrorhabdus indica]
MAFIKFSTLDFPLKERIEAAQDIYAAIANIELRTLDKCVPMIETRLRLLPGVSIGWAKTSPIVVNRREKHIQDGNDDFSLLLNPLGHSAWNASIEKKGDFICSPGMGCFSYNDRPGSITFQGAQTHMLNITFSRALFEPLISRVAMDGYARLDVEILPLLTRSALELMVENPTTPINPLEQVNQLIDLASLAVGVHSDYGVHARQHGLKQARMKAVKADILIHFYRGDLSLDWLAKRHGVSASYIRSMFEQEETSFTDYLLEIRLQKAFDSLTNPDYASINITDIAYNVGFNNPSWFYRAFKRRFGFVPSDVR